MLGHNQGQMLNAAQLAAALGISGQTVARYLDITVDLLLPVLGEALAASGIIGVLPFLWFLGVNTIGYIKEIRLYWPEERAK
jgi:hypothetical protein